MLQVLASLGPLGIGITRLGLFSGNPQGKPMHIDWIVGHHPHSTFSTFLTFPTMTHTCLSQCRLCVGIIVKTLQGLGWVQASFHHS